MPPNRALQTDEHFADYRKNPNEMNGAAWRWDGGVAGDTIRFIFANPPFLPGRDWRLTLVRVE